MVRPIPLQFGVYYHIFNRGNNRENLFFEERNYRHFLRLYAKYILPVVDTYAYCLLPNHFHLLIRVKPEEEQALGTAPAPDDVGTARAKPQQEPKETQSITPKILSPSRQFAHCFNAYSKAVNKAYGRIGTAGQAASSRDRFNVSRSLRTPTSHNWWSTSTAIHRNTGS